MQAKKSGLSGMKTGVLTSVFLSEVRIIMRECQLPAPPLKNALSRACINRWVPIISENSNSQGETKESDLSCQAGQIPIL